MKKYSFILKNLDCANCANKIQNKLAENPSYKNVVVNFNTLKLTLESDLENIKPDIEKTVKELEPEVEVLDFYSKQEKIYQKKDKNINQDFIRLVTGIVFVLIGTFLKLPWKLNLICIIVSYIILLFRTGKNSIKLLRKKH